VENLVSVGRWFLGVAVLLAATPAFAQELPPLSGLGRFGALVGWRVTSNGEFFREAEAQGFVREGPASGGPMLVGSFGYSPIEAIEVGVDPFIATEVLDVIGAAPLRTVTYGALLGARLQLTLARAVPFIGLFTGPVLTYATGGTQTRPAESFAQAFALSLGATLRIDPKWGLTLEYKGTWGPGVRTDLGPASIGGHWVGIGVAGFVEGERSARQSGW
jgi:hypothetical protein